MNLSIGNTNTTSRKHLKGTYIAVDPFHLFEANIFIRPGTRSRSPSR